MEAVFLHNSSRHSAATTSQDGVRHTWHYHHHQQKHQQYQQQYQQQQQQSPSECRPQCLYNPEIHFSHFGCIHDLSAGYAARCGASPITKSAACFGDSVASDGHESALGVLDSRGEWREFSGHGLLSRGFLLPGMECQWHHRAVRLYTV